MERVRVDGVDLAYEECGTGDETVVLSHSYLVDRRQFDSQVAVLAERYRVLAFDHRGHGDSDKPSSGYDMESIYRDAEGFIEATDAAPCHFVGLSTGGFVGLRLALRRPDLLRSLVLMDTSAEAESYLKRAKYEAMFAVVKRVGWGRLIDKTMSLMFGPDFLSDSDRATEVSLWRDRIMANDVEALIGFGRGIFGRDDLVERLNEIDVPTLVMVGEHDEPQPIARAQVIADGVAGSRLLVIPRAGHLSTIENPDFVNEVLVAFFDDGRLPTPGGEPVNVRTPRSAGYDGSIYGRVVEPLLAGVHGFVADNLPAGERVLDACCGTGGLARQIAATGRHVVGVDLSPRNIEFAKQQVGDSSINFDVGDVAQLPYGDGEFDTATLVLAIHEMPQACRVPVLRELARVAAQVLVVDFLVPMPVNVAGVRNRALEVAAGRAHYGAFRDYARRGGLSPLVEQAGLTVVSQRGLDKGTLTVQVVERSA